MSKTKRGALDALIVILANIALYTVITTIFNVGFHTPGFAGVMLVIAVYTVVVRRSAMYYKGHSDV